MRGRDIGTFVKECKKKINEKVKLKAGYYLRWGGQFENQERAMSKLAVLVPLSIAIIFVLLTATFGSIRYALVVLLNVPFALIGGVLALYVRGFYLSVPAAIGFIALFGVAVLNGVVLVSYVNRLVKSGNGSRRSCQRRCQSTIQAGNYDCTCGRLRVFTHVGIGRLRGRSAKASGDCCYRRFDQFDPADAVGTACSLLPGDGQAKKIIRPQPPSLTIHPACLLSR